MILFLLFCIFPILACPIFFLGIIFSKKKKTCALFLALSLAAIAYLWKPTNVYDLYRWYLEMKTISSFNLSEMTQYAFNEIEVINCFIKYIFAQTGNYALVQAFVSFVGYFTIFWIICDYSKRNNIKRFSIFITLIFTILSLYYIDFISGLWFNLAIIIFALGVYLDYVLNTKWIHCICYICSMFIHVSIFYILILMIYTKICNKKNIYFNIIVVILLFLVPNILFTFLHNNFGGLFVNTMYKLYNSYFVNGSQFAALHNGSNIVIALLRVSVYIIIIYFMKNTKFKNLKIFSILCIASTLALIINASVFIRYIFFIQIICIPFLLQFFNTNNINKIKIILLSFIFIVIMILCYKQYTSIVKSGIIDDVSNNATSNILNLDNRG